MAIRYTSQFRDLQNTLFTVNIFDQDYGGTSPFEFVLGDYGFRLDFEGDDRFSPIIPSTVTLPMILQNNNDAALLFNLAAAYEGRYFLEIRTGGSTISNGLLYWRGIILPEFIDVIDEAYPQQVEILATDDLANLRNVDYLQSPEGTGYALVTGHLTNAINALRTWSITADTERFRIIDDLECFRPSNSTWISFLRTQLNFATFKDAEAEPAEYWSCYEVLEEVCLAFGLRLFWKPTFDTDLTSGFVFDAWALHWYEDTFSGYNYNSGASQIGAFSQARTQFALDSTGINRLRGWRHGYLPALKEVRRSFDYLQASPFAIDHVYAEVGSATNHFDGTPVNFNPAALVHYTSGTALSLRMRINLKHDADSVTALGVRVQYLIKVRIGQYYAKRLRQFATNPIPFATSLGNDLIASFTYGETEWTTDSNDGIYFISPGVDLTIEESLTFDFAIDMPGLPGDLTSENFAFSILSGYRDDAGGSYTTYNPTEHSASGVTIYPTAIYEMQGSTIVFKATNDNTTSRLKVDLPEAKISDRVGTRGGGIFALPSGGAASDRFQPTKFRYNYNTGFESNLHALVCREWLLGQASNLRRMSGTIYDSRPQGTGECLTPFDTYTHGGNNYAAITLSYTAGINQYDIELVQLARASSGVTVPAAQFEDYIPPLPVAPSGTIASLTSTEAQVAVNAGTIDSVIPLRNGIVSLVADQDNFVSVGDDEFEVNVGAVKILEADDVSARFNVPVTLDLQLGNFTIESAGQADPLTIDNTSAVYAVEILIESFDDAVGGRLALREARDNGTAEIGLKAPNSLTTSTTYTLPSADGTSGQLLRTNGSGTLSWVSEGPYFTPVDEITTSGYTLVAGDAGRYKRPMWNTTESFTINTGTFSIGQEFEIEQGGIGTVNIVAGSGVTLLCAGSFLTNLAEQYARARVKCIASNTYHVHGHLELI
jgi:hypothetical protein